MLDAPDDMTALERLLALWPLRRTAALSEAIGRLSNRIDRSAVPAPSTHEAWLTAVRQASQPSLGPFIRTLREPDDPNPERALARLEALAAGRGPDPRIAGAVLSLLGPPLFPSTAAIWPRALRLLLRIGDPRNDAQIGFLIETSGLRERVPECVRWRPIPAPSMIPAARALAARIGAGHRQVDLANLRAEVFAAPDQIAPRLIYADRLTEVGDALGTFIALQCAPTASPAQHAQAEGILRMWREVWLGPLAPALDPPSGVRFERGFPAIGRLAIPSSVTPTASCPEWATFHTLDCGHLEDDSGLLALCERGTARGLRTLNGVWLQTAAALCAFRTPLPIESMTIRGVPGGSSAYLKALASRPSLAALRALRFTGHVDASGARDLLGLLGSRLDLLAVHGSPLLAITTGSLARQWPQLRFEIGDEALTLAVQGHTLTARWASDREAYRLLDLLGRVRPDHFDRIELHPAQRPSPTLRARLLRARDRLVA